MNHGRICPATDGGNKAIQTKAQCRQTRAKCKTRRRSGASPGVKVCNRVKLTKEVVVTTPWLFSPLPTSRKQARRTRLHDGGYSFPSKRAVASHTGPTHDDGAHYGPTNGPVGFYYPHHLPSYYNGSQASRIFAL